MNTIKLITHFEQSLYLLKPKMRILTLVQILLSWLTLHYMSSEQVNINHSIHISDVKNKNKVDINHLMSKVREEKKKEKKENLVFVGLVGTVVVITGIIASL